MLRLNHGMVSTIRGGPPDIVESVLEQVEIVAKVKGKGIWKWHNLADAFDWSNSLQGNNFWGLVYGGSGSYAIKELKKW